MLGVPKLVAGLQKQLDVLLQENYAILDEFWHNLTTEDFNKKWEVAMWAQNIMLQLEETNKIQERDKSRFQVYFVSLLHASRTF
jgi:dynein heavy chain